MEKDSIKSTEIEQMKFPAELSIGDQLSKGFSGKRGGVEAITLLIYIYTQVIYWEDCQGMGCVKKKWQNKIGKIWAGEGLNMSRKQPLDIGKAANYLKSTKMYVHVAE